MKKARSIDDMLCITAIVVGFDIAICGAIVPLAGSYLGVPLSAQIITIVVVQAILAICFYKAWKAVIKRRKEMRSLKQLSPTQFKQVRVKGQEEDGISYFAIIVYGKIRIYICIGYKYPMEGNIIDHAKVLKEMSEKEALKAIEENKDVRAEMSFYETIGPNGFIEKYEIIPDGRVFKRE